jgi:hypothetical protein
MQSNIFSCKKTLKDSLFLPRAKIASQRSPGSSQSPVTDKFSRYRVNNLKTNPISESLPRTVLGTKSMKSRIKDFEEIGVFSDLIHPKKFLKDDLENSSRQTIYITDFMARKQKIQLTQFAELDSNYEIARRGYRYKFLARNTILSSCLTPSEKLPSFFSTPQVSPRTLQDNEFDFKAFIRRDQNPRAAQLDTLIEKCNQAINLRIKSPAPS